MDGVTYARIAEAKEFFESLPCFFLSNGEVSLDLIRYHILRCLAALYCYEGKTEDAHKNKYASGLFYSTVSEAAESLAKFAPSCLPRHLFIKTFLLDTFMDDERDVDEDDIYDISKRDFDSASGGQVETVVSCYGCQHQEDWKQLHWTIILSSISTEQKLATIGEAEQVVADENGALLLHYAAASPSASIEVAKALVTPAAIRCKDVNDRVPLHWAASHSSSVAMLQYLVSEWPEATGALNEEEDTPLHALLSRTPFPGRAAMIAYLVAADPTVCARMAGESSCLRLFCQYSYDRWASSGEGALYEETFVTILAAYPDAVSKKNYSGGLPLHALCRDISDSTEGVAHDLTLVKMLLSAYKEAAAVTTTYGGLLPAHYLAIGGKYIDALKLILLAYPEALNRRANREHNMLSLAAGQATDEAQTVEMLKYFILLKPDLARVCDPKEMKFPLHHAALGNSVEAVKLLYAAYPEAALKWSSETAAAAGARMRLLRLPLHYALMTTPPGYSRQLGCYKPRRPATVNVSMIRFLLRMCPEAVNMRPPPAAVEVGVQGAAAAPAPPPLRNRLTAYQLYLQQPDQDQYILRLLLLACPAADPQRLKYLNYEARRPLMFIAFAARTEMQITRAAVKHNSAGAGAGANNCTTDFIYQLRRLMNIGKEMGLLRLIASFL